MMVPTLKKAKPPPFSAENTSLAVVNAWIFKIRAHVRASTDEEEKMETAASFLTGTAELWFMAKYALAARLPTFDEFMQVFKVRFTRVDDARQLRLSIESMTEGSRSVLEYHAEFQTVFSQIGEDIVDMDWAPLHFERGLTASIRQHVAINGHPTDSLDDLATLGQRVFDVNRQLAKENPRMQTHPTVQNQGSPRPATPRASTPRPDCLGFLTSRMPDGLFPELGGDEDHEVLRKAGICFRCRQPGHMSMECPEENKGHGGKLIVKVESVEQPVVESDQESSPYIPVPTIRISVRIPNAKTPALIDTGASVNTVSLRVAGHTKLPRLPVRPPIRIGQAFYLTGVLVKEKISVRVSIPSKNWTSKKPADFLVAPFANSEAVLGMPFLVQEQIKVNPAAHDISLPIPKAAKARPTTTRTLNLKRTQTKLA